MVSPELQVWCPPNSPLVERICAHPENADALSAKITEKKAERATIHARIAELERLRDQDDDLEAAVKGTLGELRRWAGLFELAGPDAVKAQKEVIRRCVKEVRVNYAEKLVGVTAERVMICCRAECTGEGGGGRAADAVSGNKRTELPDGAAEFASRGANAPAVDP